MEFGFDYGTLGEIPIRDVAVVAMFVAIAKRSRAGKIFESVVLPWHKDEVDLVNPAHRFKAVLSAHGVNPDSLSFEFPIAGMTKAEVIAATPPGLLELTHSCRYGSPPCGECRPCKDLQSYYCRIK